MYKNTVYYHKLDEIPAKSTVCTPINFIFILLWHCINLGNSFTACTVIFPFQRYIFPSSYNTLNRMHAGLLAVD